jgi:hypothetical protein
MAELSQEQQDYAAIELLYSEGRWMEVVQRSEALLAALTPQQQPLQARLNLVIGHALLYGLGDRPGAEQRYQAVQQNFQEPVLREIAEQGLKRCREPLQPEAAPQPTAPQPNTSEPNTAQPMSGAMPWDTAAAPTAAVVQDAGSSGGAAMPWMVELGAEPALDPAEDMARERARETLSLLRRPDEPLPVTVQVLDEVQASPGQEDFSELARGLLELELR